MLQLFSAPDERTLQTVKDKKFCPIGVCLKVITTLNEQISNVTPCLNYAVYSALSYVFLHGTRDNSN